MIDIEFINKWLVALESEEYPQTKDILRNRAGFCCLGVACNLEDPVLWMIKDDSLSYRWGSALGYPNFTIREKLGLDIKTTLKNPGTPAFANVGSILTRKNDGGATFKEIAKFYREELLPKILEVQKTLTGKR